MVQETLQRKLTAILSADVKGYSRLMGEDEDGTVRTLAAYRGVMFDFIRKHRGRVVDSPGDNVLAEFGSVVDAVRCAVEIQEELKVRNTELPESKRMEFRIGINLGDVIVEGDRLYGDGVNTAARIEGLAEAGGICISGTVYDQVETKLPVMFEYLGEQAVKNIKKPVRVYRIEREAVVPWAGRERELPDKPSIAVLPFVNMSGDPEQEYFSDGMTEEIITALSKDARLFVIARNSTFAYKGKSVNVREVGRDLGVRYVLEGSVRKAGDRVRITAQLIDARGGHHLWAERYDRNLEDLFALQDEITLRIFTALQVKLAEGEQARLWARGTDNLEAYLKNVQGIGHLRRLTREDNTLARQLLEEAIALETRFAAAYNSLAWTHLLDAWFGWSDSPEQSLAQALEFGQKALTLDDSLGDAHALMGGIYLAQQEWDKAIAEGERAVALDPNGADNLAFLAGAYESVGEPSRAMALLEKAIRLNPMPPEWYLQHLAMAQYLTGQVEKAIGILEKVLHRNPDHLPTHMCLAAIYSMTGREEKAQAEAAEVLRLDPRFSVDHIAKVAIRFKDQSENERFGDALRKAGLD